MTVVGTITLLATIDTSGYKRGEKEIDAANSRIESGVDNADRSTKRFGKTSATVFGAIAGAAAYVANRGIGAITGSISSAINRVDTLNNANRVFANMGFSADEARKSMDNITASIQGLPTTLDSAVRNVQLLAASTGDLDRSQQIFASLNNAILGFGGSSEMVENAMVQLSQAFSNGRIDAATWNSMINSGLGPALNALAKQMGITTGEFKEGLSEGTISIEDFQDALIRMNKEGGGGMQSFENIVKDATSGIQTGWTNMQTAISRGVASIISAIGSANISGAIAAIGTALESLLKVVAGVIPIISGFIGFFGDNIGIITQVAVVIGTLLVPAIIQFGIQSAVSFGRFVAASAAAAVASMKNGARIAAGLLLAMGPIGLIVAAVGAAVALIAMNWESIVDFARSAWESIASIWGSITEFFSGLWGGVVSVVSDIWSGIVNVAIGIWDGIVGVVTGAFNAITSFLSKWGLTILAIIFFPFSIVIGLIYMFKDQIAAVFTSIWQVIVAVFTPIISFLTDVFMGAYNVILNVLLMIESVIQTVIGVIMSIFSTVGSFIASVFSSAWDIVTGVFSAAVGFFSGVWSGIVSIFTPVVNFFRGIFQGAWNAIKSVFSAVSGFFRGVWDTIVSIFTNVGTAVGDAIGGTFKNIINTILKGAIGIINGFIDAINLAVDIINNIPGVNIGRLDRLNVPQLATGGVVTSATLAVIGEGSEPEAVIPLSKLDQMLSGEGSGGRDVTVNQYNTINDNVDMNIATRYLTKELARS